MIAEAFKSILGRLPQSLDQNFFEMGGHSLLAIRLVAEIGRRAGVEISAGAFLANPTLRGAGLALEVARRQFQTENQRSGARPTVIWFGASPWDPGVWPDDIHFKEILLPVECASYSEGRMVAEAAHCAQRIREWDRGTKVVLAGYCYNGLVAIEAARLLAESGCAPSGVVLIDSLPTPRPTQWAVSAARRIAGWRRLGLPEAKLSVVPWYETTYRLYHWYRLGVGGGMRRLRERSQPRGETRPANPNVRTTAVNRKNDPEFLKNLAGCYWAIAEHRVSHYHGPVTLLLAGELAARRQVLKGHPWRPYVKELTVETVPGNHVSCLEEHAMGVAERIVGHARRHWAAK
jgi:thioesterase domain-containing protein